MQILLANAKIMFDKADRKLIVNRKFAVHPIERNHYITLAISFLMIKHINCIARIIILNNRKKITAY